MSYDVMFDNKGSYTDFGLKFKSYDITMPEAKTTLVSVPGSNVTLDYTEMNGDVFYERRKLTMVFGLSASYEGWHDAVSAFANYINGQKRKIILPTDNSFYYIGRSQILPKKTDRVLGTVTVEALVYPYKKELLDGTEDWDWDTFDFENGIIREYSEITVPGTLVIDGRREKVIPTFSCSANMTVTYNGTTYNLAAGENTIYSLALGDGEHELTFAGSGKVTVGYRGGSL
jgi:hypothetical protein